MNQISFSVMSQNEMRKLWQIQRVINYKQKTNNDEYERVWFLQAALNCLISSHFKLVCFFSQNERHEQSLVLNEKKVYFLMT